MFYFFLLLALLTFVALIKVNVGMENTLNQQLYNDLLSGTRTVVSFGHLIDGRILLVIDSRKDHLGQNVFDDFYFYEIDRIEHTGCDSCISKVILANSIKLTSRFKSMKKDNFNGSMFLYNFKGTDYLLLYNLKGEKNVTKYNIGSGSQVPDMDELNKLQINTHMVVVSAYAPNVLYTLMNLNDDAQSKWQFTVKEFQMVSENRSTVGDMSCPLNVTINCTIENEQENCTPNVTISSGYHDKNGTFYLFASSVGSEKEPRVIKFSLASTNSCNNIEHELSIRTLKFVDFFTYHDPTTERPSPAVPEDDDYDSQVKAIVTTSVSTILVLTFFVIGCFFYCVWEHRRPKPDKPITRGRWCQNPATVLRDRKMSSGKGATVNAAVALQTAVEKRRKRNYVLQLTTKANSNGKNAFEQKMPKTALGKENY